ncbi:peptidoglycan/LPS O-acetylase OafA/YrhL [Fontibacillus solani]|uniref:Peptidoglycan/LPS O-acetylase OafA/YrhL n=1 Tax=Fontibacillus solani TaxID=1572857 RepID=A0A7W3XSP7_9BACL|nr:acyltransferase [Fontibacillus solani]MBA9086781.1 peptidoglycan/LPS O-acetylase OafA/YrhL [Fontibacillus solani]
MKSELLIEKIHSRSNNLDFIRLIAAVLVIVSHSYPITGQQTELFSSISRGQWTFGGIAVSIFFVISGFLISKSYEHSNLKQFILNRILRLFPAIWIVTILTVLVLGPLLTTLTLSEYFRNYSTWSYFNNAFLISIQYGLPGVFENNVYPSAINGSIWTLPYEILCYIGLAIIGYYGLIKKGKGVLLLFIIIFILNSIIPQQLLNTNIHGFLLGSLLELILYFLMGAIFYSYRESIKLKPIWAISCIVVLIITMQLGNFKGAFLFCGSYLIVFFAFYGKSIFSKVSKYGDLSYGIYIYAFPVQQIVQWKLNNQTSPFINFMISLPITLTFAFFSWHLVEKQALKFKKNTSNSSAIKG